MGQGRAVSCPTLDVGFTFFLFVLPMQTATDSSGARISQLTAINIAKIVTILCLAILAAIYGISDLRAALYLCLHVSYCSWWLLEQWLFPQRRQQIFTDKVGMITVGFVILYVGVFYAFPGYLAFVNPEPIGYLSIAISLPLFIFGSLINTAADIQKTTAKAMGATLVKDGIWRLLRHPNYLGDLMRYTSFAAIAGSLWAYLLPGSVLLLYLQLIRKKEVLMAEKYPEFADYARASQRLLPGIW